MMELPKYIQLEHTADIRIRVLGKDLPELFANAGFAFFDLVADLSNVQERDSVEIRAAADDIELLLVAWLNELLYWFDASRMLFRRFDIVQFNKTQIVAKAFGEKYDPQRHHMRAEIKAVTYHHLAVEQMGDHWEASVIFDI